MEDAAQIIAQPQYSFDAVTLPHTWYQNGNAYQGLVLYEQRFLVDFQPNQRVFITFGAADRWCKVFVNGQFAGEHQGGYSAFTFEITNLCTNGENNHLQVLLDNRHHNTIPPLAGDFTVYGGLYRYVEVFVTQSACFDRTYYGTCGVICKTSVEDGVGKLELDARVLNGENTQVRYRLEAPDAAVVLESCCEPSSKTTLQISSPKLWNGQKDPAMYTLYAMLEQNGQVVDSVSFKVGFRSVRLDAQKGFFLNETHMKLNGVAKHQDFDGVYCATTQEHCRKDLALIKEIGANSVRLSHYQHPQMMYDLCDEEGLVVWAEIPMLKFLDDEALFQNACQQMKELILQNMHHPSICFWGIQNEIAIFGESEPMYERMQQLEEQVKQLDDTRLSACANLYCVKPESKLNHITKAVGYNIYFGWYYGEMQDNASFVEQFHKANPHVPLGITEYGVDCNLAYHSAEPKVKDYSEEFQARYHETVYPIFRSKEYIWGIYIWNLCDFGSAIRDEGGTKYKNCKGIVSFDRTIKKDAFYYYKAQWSAQPFVKIAESRFVNRASRSISVKVYSNQPSVELITPAGSFCKCSNDGVFVFENVPLELGEQQFTAKSGEFTDSVVFVGVEQPDASYVFVDENPGINVKNWFIDAAEEEKLFPTGYFSIRDCGDDLVQSEEAMQVIAEFSEKLASSVRERKGKLPLERVLNYMKKEFSDADCRRLNDMLTKVKK